MITPLPNRTAGHDIPLGGRVLRYPRHSLILLGGLPGAGKSTLLNRLYGLSGDETGTVRTSNGIHVVDSLQSRNRLTRWLGSSVYPAWRWATHLLHYLRVLTALRHGEPVVVHEPATRGLVRRLLGLYCRLTGAEFHVLLIDADSHDARRGQIERGRMVTARSFRTHERRWRVLLETCARSPERMLPEARSLTVLDRSQATLLRRIEFGGLEWSPAQPHPVEGEAA